MFSDEQTPSKIGSCVSPNTRFRINSPDVVQDTIDGEAVIVNLRTGHYYSLENTGAQIWGLIEQGFGLEDTIRWICSRYEGIKEEIAQAIKDLVEELRKEELLIPLNGASSALSSSLSSQVDPGCDRKNFERPALQKYTDMQDILLLDPIHDVDESGWPHMKIDKME